MDRGPPISHSFPNLFEIVTNKQCHVWPKYKLINDNRASKIKVNGIPNEILHSDLNTLVGILNYTLGRKNMVIFGDEITREKFWLDLIINSLIIVGSFFLTIRVLICS